MGRGNGMPSVCFASVCLSVCLFSRGNLSEISATHLMKVLWISAAYGFHGLLSQFLSLKFLFNCFSLWPPEQHASCLRWCVLEKFLIYFSKASGNCRNEAMQLSVCFLTVDGYCSVCPVCWTDRGAWKIRMWSELMLGAAEGISGEAMDWLK